MVQVRPYRHHQIYYQRLTSLCESHDQPRCTGLALVLTVIRIMSVHAHAHMCGSLLDVFFQAEERANLLVKAVAAHSKYTQDVRDASQVFMHTMACIHVLYIA